MSYIAVVVLILFSGIFSGLTLGLLSLNKSELKRKILFGNQEALKVYSIREKGNLLLCTLLLGNVAVNSAAAILLGNIASGFIAGIIATSLIVIFGEIVPQATVSRHALYVGSRMVWLVRFFIFIFYPICGPMAWLLDKFLGEEMPSIYSKHEIIQMVKEHGGSEHSDVDHDEGRIIEGALSFSDKSVSQVMTPIDKVYAIEKNKILDRKLLINIKKEGFARIPVYDKKIDNIFGLLYIKDLLAVKENIKIETLCIKEKVINVSKNDKLDHMLETFIKNKTHLAFVKNNNNIIIGVISLEDVIEEIINEEIIDETDFSDER